MGRKYDIIIFGATGFTGKFVVEQIIKLLRDSGESLTWAVSGRSESKLREVLKGVSASTGEDLSNVATIIADVASEKSLREMAGQGKIVINCVGPYRFFGEAVVKACVEEGTHHVDISGEPQYLERMQVTYNDKAKEKGVYIIGSCGFDSIPCDVGITYLEQNFNGDLNSVEMYLETNNHGKGGGFHYATWQSAIHGLAHANELRSLRKALFPKTLPKSKFQVPQRGVLHYSDAVKGWCLPFPGSDRSVVKRSQYNFFFEEKKRPVLLSAFVKMPSLFVSILAMIGGLIFGVLAQFRIGRYLLETFPKVFSAGLASHEGPSVESMQALEFKMTLKGVGWSEKLAEATDQHSEPPNKTVTATVSGFDPGYGLTAAMVLLSAVTVIRETEKLPGQGGVLTPGYAFAKTTLIPKLEKAGLKFAIQSS